MTYVPIIIGSPRKSGDSVLLAIEAEKGLHSRGISTEIFYLNFMKFSGCQACYACKQEHNIDCPVDDDMQEIYAALSHSDGIILATPIYFGGVTGQMKLWLDRLFPYIAIDLSNHLPKKIPLSIIYTQNQPDTTLFTGAMDTFEYALRLIGFETKDRLVAGDLDAGRKPGVDTYPDLIKNAYHLGETLISI